MTGTIPLSLTQQFDEFGKPLSGGLLYIIQAGSVATPQQPWQDFGKTVLQPNPILLDAAGRVPQFFLDDGYVKFRLVSKTGVTQYERDFTLVIGPSLGGGGGGGGADPTTLIQTGMLAMFYGTGGVTGYVRANARTIGNAASGASERFAADTQALWIFLYTVDPNLAVSGGRTGNALNDYNAAKQLTLPDLRGRVIAGLDDMGNVPANRLTALFGTPTVLGAVGGGETKTLLTGNLPPYTPAGGITNGAITFNGGTPVYVGTNHSNQSGTNTDVPTGAVQLTVAQAASTFNGTPQGGTSTPVPVTQPTLLTTIYLKL